MRDSTERERERDTETNYYFNLKLVQCNIYREIYFPQWK